MLADWITIDIPWYTIAFGTMGLLFWPLTALTAAAAFVAWRTPLRAARVLFAVPAALWVISAYVNVAPWVAGEVERAQIRSRIYVAGTHQTGEVTLARDTTIDGVPCSATQTVHLDFLSHLSECAVAAPTIVRGVPCRGNVSVDYRVRCVLAADYARFGYVWRSSTEVIDNGGGDVTFLIGSMPPTLAVLHAALPKGTQVQYTAGKLFAIDLVERPIRYGSCDVSQLLARAAGGFDASCTGGGQLMLPRSAIGEGAP